MTKIRPRDRDAVIQSLRAGVVPRIGAHHIQVGRLQEVKAMIGDIERVADGGSSFRVITGEYGAGKTFFLSLVRAIGLEKKLVVTTADLNPDRRLHGTGGQARSLYAELMRNMATRTKPDGNALPGIVEKFVSSAKEEAIATGTTVDMQIRRKLDSLTELVNGYDFADVIAAYWTAHQTGNEQVKSDAIRWLRGEFETKSDARKTLKIRSIVEDGDVYDQLKLMARFVTLAGYGGLLVSLDEMVNLYKINHSVSRNSNYEQILRILNDSLQGNAVGLGFVLGGTPEFLKDQRRGLYSYAALQSRLAGNSFASEGRVDLTGPVIPLTALSPEDFYVLLEKVRHVYAGGEPEKYLLPDDGIVSFMQHCANTLGAQFFKTPRTTITGFINLLAVLEQNPGTAWTDLIDQVEVERDTGGDSDQVASDAADEDELASFRL